MRRKTKRLRRCRVCDRIATHEEDAVHTVTIRKGTHTYKRTPWRTSVKWEPVEIEEPTIHYYCASHHG